MVSHFSVFAPRLLFVRPPRLSVWPARTLSALEFPLCATSRPLCVCAGQRRAELRENRGSEGGRPDEETTGRRGEATEPWPAAALAIARSRS